MITEQQLTEFFPVFNDMLEKIAVPGMPSVSWDRRAAYMLLTYAEGKPDFPQFVAWLQAQPKKERPNGTTS